MRKVADEVVPRVIACCFFVLVGIGWYFEKKWSLTNVLNHVGFHLTPGEIEFQAMVRLVIMAIVGMAALVIPSDVLEERKKKD